jgi:hypothetical protein
MSTNTAWSGVSRTSTCLAGGLFVKWYLRLAAIAALSPLPSGTSRTCSSYPASDIVLAADMQPAKAAVLGRGWHRLHGQEEQKVTSARYLHGRDLPLPSTSIHHPPQRAKLSYLIYSIYTEARSFSPLSPHLRPLPSPFSLQPFPGGSCARPSRLHLQVRESLPTSRLHASRLSRAWCARFWVSPFLFACRLSPSSPPPFFRRRQAGRRQANGKAGAHGELSVGDCIPTRSVTLRPGCHTVVGTKGGQFGKPTNISRDRIKMTMLLRRGQCVATGVVFSLFRCPGSLAALQPQNGLHG